MLRNKNSKTYFELHPKRILLSQNFLKNKAQVYHLVKNSKINEDDIVIEIGPGKGIITKFLVQRAKEVIAVEIDAKLVNKLEEKFKDIKNLKIIRKDINEYIFPQTKFKIFSNIPFNLASEIIRKILVYKNGPEEAFIVVPIEIAKRFGGRPIGKSETLVSLLNKPFFTFKIFFEFNPTDFNPAPNVKPVMLKIKKRSETLIDLKHKELYEDFLTFTFLEQKIRLTNALEKIFSYNQIKIMSKNLGFDIKSTLGEVTFEQWIGIFETFLDKVPDEKKRLVRGSLQARRKFKLQ